MFSTNYSNDAELLMEEVYDFDTRDEHETGINDGRMRLPERYDIAKYYKRNERSYKNHRAGEYGQWLKKDEEDLPDISDDFEWQITYSFPATIRNPYTQNGVTYGGKNVTFRRLYLILCEHFNGGEYFIDSYFDSVYPYTVKPIVDEKLSTAKSELLQLADSMIQELNEQNMEEGLGDIQINKDGTLSRRATNINKRAYKALGEYESFASEWEASEGDEVASIIKQDIISCVTTGQLPCQFISAPRYSTMRKRIDAGLSPTPLFSATRQLIESIKLYAKIGGNGKWQTESGLRV